MSGHRKIMAAKCICGSGLNWLALLFVKEPRNGQVELVLTCQCDRLYRAFLPLDGNQMPVETQEES